MDVVLSNPGLSIAVLLGIAAAMLFAELLLPTHGLLGGLGILSLIGVIVLCYRVNGWLGIAAVLGMAVTAPFVATAAMKIWPKTIVGKRMMLQPIHSPLTPASVRVGDRGVTLSELRPMGVVTFGDDRLEARSERNMLPPGTSVIVVSTVGGRVVVRAEETAT